MRALKKALQSAGKQKFFVSAPGHRAEPIMAINIDDAAKQAAGKFDVALDKVTVTTTTIAKAKSEPTKFVDPKVKTKRGTAPAVVGKLVSKAKGERVKKERVKTERKPSARKFITEYLGGKNIPKSTEVLKIVQKKFPDVDYKLRHITWFFRLYERGLLDGKKHTIHFAKAA